MNPRGQRRKHYGAHNGATISKRNEGLSNGWTKTDLVNRDFMMITTYMFEIENYKLQTCSWAHCMAHRSLKCGSPLITVDHWEIQRSRLRFVGSGGKLSVSVTPLNTPSAHQHFMEMFFWNFLYSLFRSFPFSPSLIPRRVLPASLTIESPGRCSWKRADFMIP